MEAIRAKPLIVFLGYAFIGWALCGAVVWIGRMLTSLDNALVIHAIAVPIIFSTISVIYFKTFDYTTPFQTAIGFVSFVIFLDIFVVALLIEKSFEMFTNALGTWIPFSLIFASTYLSGLYSKKRNRPPSPGNTV